MTDAQLIQLAHQLQMLLGPKYKGWFTQQEREALVTASCAIESVTHFPTSPQYDHLKVKDENL